MDEVHRNHQKQVENQVEVAVTADELGYDYALHPEHHFLMQNGSANNPLFTQSAVASRTEDIRLLQTAIILPWNEPIRIAEQAAMLDILSDGRVDIGIGIGTRTLENEPLGQYWGASSQNRAEAWESFEEKYEILVQAWTENFVDHHGTFHDVPPKHTIWENKHDYYYLKHTEDSPAPTEFMSAEGDEVTLNSLPIFPQPKQDPHPMMWRPTMSEGSVKWAAERGINGAVLPGTISQAKNLIDTYYEVAEEADWPDHRPEHDGEPFKFGWDADRRRGVACCVTVFNTDVADDETLERWRLGQEFVQSNNIGAKPDVSGAAIDATPQIESDETLPMVTDTEGIIERITELKEAIGYEDFILFVKASNPGLSREETEAQLRAFSEEVAPHFEE
ncbi:LLM class flavin-dependent oxidoreductase [Halorussus caseinilyticus]|uniref:LLM class flavin-dependent oxidoreductase n=1 Tax=Halorussus caseinilyticus TaxID=3034025 RepID=A0ABD5WR74_9EURY|nr:LLM class flavin-dependent oxidoreductase [Halorussus sp. DT72]